MFEWLFGTAIACCMGILNPPPPVEDPEVLPINSPVSVAEEWVVISPSWAKRGSGGSYRLIDPGAFVAVRSF